MGRGRWWVGLLTIAAARPVRRRGPVVETPDGLGALVDRLEPLYAKVRDHGAPP